jgi:hypothetical protein
MRTGSGRRARARRFGSSASAFEPSRVGVAQFERRGHPGAETQPRVFRSVAMPAERVRGGAAWLAVSASTPRVTSAARIDLRRYGAPEHRREEQASQSHPIPCIMTLFLIAAPGALG